MISKKNVIIIAAFVALFGKSITHADVIGSDTAVSVLSNYTFPQNPLAFANTIANFGYAKNGFTLANASTDLLFDSVFPVSGDVRLNGGEVTLNQDLIFANATNLLSGGTIIAGDHLVDLCSSIIAFPSGQNYFENARLQLNRFIAVNSDIIFNGFNIFNGGGDNVIMGNAGSINVASGSTLLLKDMNLKNVGANSITLADDTSKLALHNVTLHLTDDITFSVGALTIIGDVTIEGLHTLFYSSSQTSTILQDAQLCIADGATLSIGRYDSTSDVQPLAFIDETSVLRFDQSNFIVTGSGMQITKGTIEIDKFVEVDIVGTSTTLGLIVGDDILGNDCVMRLGSGASLRFGSGYFTYNCVSPNQVISSSSNAQFIRSVSSDIYVAQSIAFPASTIVLESNLTPAIQVAPGKSLQYNNVQLALPDSLFSVQCDRYNQYTFYLDGNDDYLFLTKGVMPLYVYVSGASNRIEGTGHIGGMISFHDSASHLNINLQGTLDNNIILNGGNIDLTGDLSLGNNVLLTGSGAVDLAGHTLHLPSNDMAWTNTVAFHGLAGVIQLHGNLLFSSTATCNGTMTINGNGNILELGSTGQIVIGSNSQVRLKDIVLNGVSTSNIICVDDTSSLILDNVTWVQDADYTFSVGSIKFVNNVDMFGAYTFIYDSSQTSTIAQKSTWQIANGLQLLIGKKSDDALVQPLEFIDLSSVLMFDNASLTVNPHGVQFTKGTVATVRDVQIDVVSTSSATGLILGDGTAAGDMIFQMHPGCSTRYVNGSVVYNITNGDGIQANTNTINLIRSDASIFWLNQNLQLANLSLDVGNGSLLSITPGKMLTYSNATMNAPQGSFTLNGTRYNPYTTLLAGNQSIFMIKGYLPLYTLVASTGNVIEGNGNIGGAVILQNSSAQLTWRLNGTLLNTMYMNGGSLVLAANFNCANGIKPSGTGMVHMANNSFNFGQADLNISDALYWDGTKGVVNINSNIALSNTWTFSGECILDCHNHMLDISSGNIVVEKGSHLTIRNVKMQDISGSRIACLDDAASIVLDNIIWLQNGDYAFTHGSLLFKNDVIMRGSSIFAYQSNQVSTIDQHASLMFDDGFTFSYDPINSTSSQLLSCINNESQICLNNATLYAAGPGLQLIKGKVTIDGLCSFASEVTVQFGDPGIILGDCSAVDDLMCIITGGSKLTISQGSLQYKNVNASSFVMLNSMASLWIGDNASLYLYQNLNAAGMTIFGNNATLGQNPFAQLLMGTSQTGILNNVTTISC